MYDGAAGAVGDPTIAEDAAEGSVDDGGGGAVIRRIRVGRRHVRSVGLKEARSAAVVHSKCTGAAPRSPLVSPCQNSAERPFGSPRGPAVGAECLAAGRGRPPCS